MYLLPHISNNCVCYNSMNWIKVASYKYLLLFFPGLEKTLSNSLLISTETLLIRHSEFYVFSNNCLSTTHNNIHRETFKHQTAPPVKTDCVQTFKKQQSRLTAKRASLFRRKTLSILIQICRFSYILGSCYWFDTISLKQQFPIFTFIR